MAARFAGREKAALGALPSSVSLYDRSLAMMQENEVRANITIALLSGCDDLMDRLGS